MIDQPASQTPPTDLVTHIASSDLFGLFDPATLHDLEKELELVRLAPGENLCRQGDPGDSMFVLIEGCLGVRIKNPDGTVTIVDRLQPGANVGEMALLTGQERMATVYAEKDSELVKLSRAGFDRIAEQQPQIIAKLAQATIPRLQRTHLTSILTSLFGELDAAAVHYLQGQFEWRHLPGGSTLFRQGDCGDDMFIVVNGRIRFVLEKEDGSEQTLGEVSAGEMIGEFALLTDEVRSATAYAIRDTDVVRLSRSAFEQLITRYPQALMQITRLIANKQRSIFTSESKSATAITIAVAPTSSSVPLPEFAHRLADVLATFGSTLYLSHEHFDRRYGKPGAALTPEDHPLNTALVAWLSEQERKVQYLVYETDLECSAWTMRCLRQADRVLLVGVAESDPAPGEIEMACQRLESRSRTELVLLQPESIKRPSGTRHWLEQRQVAAHHHVRPNNMADVQRLARRLTGQGVGLVLSGGGARGSAHAGVWRALGEAEIPIDLIGGTSIGSLLGGFFALDLEYREVVAIMQAWSSPRKLFDPTLPVVSFFTSKKVTHSYQQIFGDVQIEDLWRPFFCVSCNLTQGSLILHQRGPLWQAIRASSSIPGIFSPVPYQGDLLVDGGALNNLPIDLMQDFGQGGPIIAVSVTAEEDIAKDYDFGNSISGWQVLLSRILPFGKEVEAPLIFETLLRLMTLTDAYYAKGRNDLADLYLRPPVERFGTMDFGSFVEIAEIGHRTAQQAIEEWKQNSPDSRLAQIIK